MNGKFVEKYGQAWSQMEQDEKMMAIMSEIFDLNEHVKGYSATYKKVDKHDVYFKFIGAILVLVVIPLSIAAVKYACGW